MWLYSGLFTLWQWTEYLLELWLKRDVWGPLSRALGNTDGHFYHLYWRDKRCWLSLYLRPRGLRVKSESCWGSTCAGCGRRWLLSQTAAALSQCWCGRPEECLRGKNNVDARCHERTTCSQWKWYFHNKHPVFTFHQYSEDIPCDGKCRSNDESGEQERANWICYFIFRLWGKQKHCYYK